ncbi:MAG: NAD-dependent epimerase/dehydratase family protein [Succinivibrio dextrinosolvens]|nr:NAD-dependent epimerase/dehydratase family protein [Succinivibrio dextrinosolvens]MDY6470514.1 NAD-dependent epimerase/dehydratase family protein [Succinivibrio dextrinosolvens]
MTKAASAAFVLHILLTIIQTRNSIRGETIMRILITGGSGFIGRELVTLLRKQNDTIFVYTHKKQITNNLGFSNDISILQASDDFPDVDVIVNLAGESIAQKRLSQKRLNEILKSRLDTIDLLAEKYAENFPAHFLQASATGIYIDNCEQDEKGELANTVYADICKNIEKKANELKNEFLAAISILRIGVVVGDGGGLVENLKYLPTLHLIGGSNYIPYLKISDCAKAIKLIIEKKIQGNINLCSDHYLTANELLKLSSSSKLLTVPVPKFALKLDKRGELLLTNQRIFPATLKENGFVFDHF